MNKMNYEELIAEIGLLSKEDVLKCIDAESIRMETMSQKDKLHSASFYRIYDSLLERFKKNVDRTPMMNHLDKYWSYRFSVSDRGATLQLTYTNPDKFYDGIQDKTKHELPMYMVPLVVTNCRMLDVSNYAIENGVSENTVRTWLRRGKLRSAERIDEGWKIPELCENNLRGYTIGKYICIKSDYQYSEKFDYLAGASRIIITQDDRNKRYYLVTMMKIDGSQRFSMIESEREELERYLIMCSNILVDDNICDYGVWHLFMENYMGEAGL